MEHELAMLCSPKRQKARQNQPSGTMYHGKLFNAKRDRIVNAMVTAKRKTGLVWPYCVY